MVMVIDPPDAPMSVAGGLLSIVTSVPGLALISNVAGPYPVPELANTTEPVLVRKPDGETVTVPPELVS
jgi:hypothetical protein